jgi:hypothetical protein
VVGVDRRWLETRRDLVDERMRGLDFFGSALEQTPWREEFWPAYEALAKAIFSLRQMILACMDAGDKHETANPVRNLKKAQRHAGDAIVQLYMLTDVAFYRLREFAIVRHRLGESALQAIRRDHLRPNLLETIHDCAPEGIWDQLLQAYDVVFENIRLATIAYPTGEMDQ